MLLLLLFFCHVRVLSQFSHWSCVKMKKLFALNLCNFGNYWNSFRMFISLLQRINYEPTFRWNLKAGLCNENFLSHLVKFSFHAFLSTFNTFIQLRYVNEIFQSTIMKVFQKKKMFSRFLIKFFLLKYISRIKDKISIENDVND